MTGQPEFQRITTADGARLTCKRLPGAGRPVIFVHGLAVNADIWDIPAVQDPAFSYRSLPSFLREHDADVWLLNLRGHGAPDMLSHPPEDQQDWCVDHFILHDLPAVIDHVWETRRQPVTLVGNSMGAMTIAGVLQGARVQPRADGFAVAADPELAQRRQEQVIAAVYLEFPAALRWPQSLYDEMGELRWDALLRDWASAEAHANFPFEMMARSAWVHALLDATGQVRLDWMRTRRDGGSWWQSYPWPIAGALQWSERAVVDAARGFSERFKGAQNFNPTMFTRGLLTAVDHMKAGVLKQMGRSVRARSFISALGAPDYDYTSGYPLIRTPALVIVGGRDRIANAGVTREVFFERIQAEVKRFELFPDLSHGEFEYAPQASERVYPLIRDWIAERWSTR